MSSNCCWPNASYQPNKSLEGLDETTKTTVKIATVMAKIWTRDLCGSRSHNPSYIKLQACSLTSHSTLITCVVESSAVFNSRPTPISVLNYSCLANIYDRSDCRYHDAHLSLVLVNGLGARDTGMSSWRYTGSGATYIPRGAVRVAATDPAWIYTGTRSQPMSVAAAIVCHRHIGWWSSVVTNITPGRTAYSNRL